MNPLINKIQNIPNLYVSPPVSEADIITAENKLGIRFSTDYRDYLKTFGAIDFYATEWMGLNTDDFRDVVKTTIEARETYEDFPKDKFILEDLHIDNVMILSDSQNGIYQWQNGRMEQIYTSLLDYLEHCIERQNY